MAQNSMQDVWETSLLGRLTLFALATWDSSLIGRMAGALGRFCGQIFAGSVLGKVWYSDWPAAGYAADSFVGRLLASLNGWAARIGRRLSPWLTGLWESSLFVRLGQRLFGLVSPYLAASLLYQAMSGYQQDLVLAPGEVARRPAPRVTPPEVFLLGWLLGLVPLVPTDATFAGIHLPSPTVLMIVGVWAVAVVWLGHKIISRDFHWRASSAFLPIGLFLLVAAAGAIQSASRSASVLNFIIWVTAILLFWMVVNLVRSTRDAAALLGPVLVGAALMTFWAIYQYYHPPVILEAWVDPATSGSLTRVFASMGNPNYLGEYLALYLPLGIGLWFHQPRHRWEMTLLSGLMLLGLVLSFSRGAWLAFMIAMVIAILMRERRWSVLMFLAGAAALVLAPSEVLRRFMSAFTLQDSSNWYRVNVWQGVLAMIHKFWVLGAGLGATAFASVYDEFMLSGARAAHAHNTYLEMFAELGILGLITILWSLIGVIRRPFVVGLNPRNSYLVAAVPAALIGLMFHGMVEYIWYNPKMLFAFWAVAGLGMGLVLGDREDVKG